VAEWYEMVDWVQIGIQFGAVGLGAFLGFIFAISLDRRQKEEKIKERRKQTVSSLLTELHDMKNALKKSMQTKPIGWDPIKHDFSGHYFSLSFSSFDSTINAGDLTLLPPETQMKLSHLKNYFHDYNLIVNQILTFNTTSVFTSQLADQTATILNTNLNIRTSEIKNKINDAITNLKKIEKAISSLEKKRKFLILSLI